MKGSTETLNERTTVLTDELGNDRGGGELPIHLLLKNPNVDAEMTNDLSQCCVAVSIKHTQSQRGALPWTTIAANMKQSIERFPHHFSERDEDGDLPLSVVCALDPTRTTIETKESWECSTTTTPTTTDDPKDDTERPSLRSIAIDTVSQQFSIREKNFLKDSSPRVVDAARREFDKVGLKSPVVDAHDANEV